jgi:pyruvate kinase
VAATLPVGVALLAMAELDDELHVTEARGRTRVLKLIRNEGKSWLAECRQHSYVENDAKCLLLRQGKVVAKGYVTPIPDVFPPIVLHVGDILVLTRGAQMGRHAWYRQGSGELLEPASIPCTLDAVFGSAKPGEPIWLDDGKIGGVIERCAADRIEVRIQQALPQGSKLRAGKGINLPETELEMPALTEVDIQHLDILAKQVDVIGLSFVRTPDDVLNLHRLLDEREASQVGVVLKIETPQAFSNLPMILLARLRRPPVGVMVARGDLAVEIGFERLAEVQEEILWLCEAAHIPVIWATQVLESMAKTGMPSRAEVSDAALAVRAECVMLNKGPYIVDTVRFLSGVLERMSSHRDKTRPMLRRLSVSKILDHEH